LWAPGWEGRVPEESLWCVPVERLELRQFLWGRQRWEQAADRYVRTSLQVTHPDKFTSLKSLSLNGGTIDIGS